MWNRAVSYLLSLLSFFYQAIVPCPFPELLPANTIDHQQYLGKWYFRAAVSRYEAQIAKFQPLDSLWFNMERSGNGTLLLTGHAHMKGICIKETWTYRIHTDRYDLEQEGKPSRRSLLWSGRWADCGECIILQEIEPPLSPSDSEDSLNRFLLYARRSDVDPGVVAAFLKRTACNDMLASVTLPQEKEFCD
ncbi:apolipoprotein M [Takifugu rubripes]|uniref:apolipoprotein M n=1 Tax=Takifugu rubripes TaxID=31033 RepID=UPI000298EC0F|nr:apolipoprotein M [Takifugu rubripes]|eukprot:XP_003965754.1 PREDICTED: apolipoprotein M [Takifugu rubripes]